MDEADFRVLCGPLLSVMLRSTSRIVRRSRLSARAFSASPLSSQGPATETSSNATTPAAPPPPTQWTRPVEPGVLPAYDEALAYILNDSENLRAKLAERKAGKDGKWTQAEFEKLEIESEVNLPEVRWNFKQGKSEYPGTVMRAQIHETSKRSDVCRTFH